MPSRNSLRGWTFRQHRHPFPALRTTWTGYIQGEIYINQIDYIVILQRQKHLITDARTRTGAKFQSDHNLVITTFNLSNIYYQRRIEHNQKNKYDLAALAQDPEIKRNFQQQITININNLPHITNLAESDSNLTEIILTAAKNTIPKAPILLDGKIKYYHDAAIVRMSEKRKILHINIKRSNNLHHIRLLSKKRQAIDKKLKKRLKQIQNNRISQLADDLEANRSNSRCFMVQRLLKKKQFQQFNLVDNEGITCSSPNEQLPLITNFYKTFYNQVGYGAVESWMGEARPLQEPISPEEVTSALKKLNNGRATGRDKISGEFLKYGGPQLIKQLSKQFNHIFSEHQHMPSIGEGILIALNKPGKSKEAKNTRPITLLNTKRKTLSTILLERIYDAVDRFISFDQSGFRKGRSKTDVLWTYGWMTAAAQKYEEQFHVMGIDMSKAFDCLDREFILSTAQELLEEDEMRILLYLLSNTTLTAIIGGQEGEKFYTTIGTPQGDSLSPLLFILYLEAVMRKYREEIIPIPEDGEFYLETKYADDCDFISHHTPDNNFIT